MHYLVAGLTNMDKSHLEFGFKEQQMNGSDKSHHLKGRRELRRCFRRRVRLRTSPIGNSRQQTFICFLIRLRGDEDGTYRTAVRVMTWVTVLYRFQTNGSAGGSCPQHCDLLFTFSVQVWNRLNIPRSRSHNKII